MSRWSLESWKNFILDQAPGWQDNQDLKNTTNQIRKKPPIVFKDEIFLNVLPSLSTSLLKIDDLNPNGI